MPKRLRRNVYRLFDLYFMKKALLITSGFLLIGIAYFVFFGEKQPVDMNQVKEDLTISATELYADYRQDESAANEKFLNKTVVVSGEIIEIEKGRNGMPRLKLYSGGQSFGVQCLFDKESTHRRLEFHRGEQVTLKCICSDYYNDVELTNCVEVR